MNTRLILGAFLAAVLILAFAALLISWLTRPPTTTPTITPALVAWCAIRLTGFLITGMAVLGITIVCTGLAAGLFTIDQALHWVITFTTTSGDAMSRNTPVPSTSP